MKLLRWIGSLFCDFKFSNRIKGNKRLKGESRINYNLRRKTENKLTKAYISGDIYKARG